MENLLVDENRQVTEEIEKELLPQNSFRTPLEGFIPSESEREIIDKYIKSQEIWEFSESIPNFSYLGDVIETIIEARYPPKPRCSFPSGPHYFPIKINLMGPLFSGKHTYAKFLESKYGLKFLEIEKILEDRNKVLERKQELEEGKKPKKIQEDEPELFVEECVNSPGDSSKEKARLIRARLRGLFGDEPRAEEETKKNPKKDEVKCQGWGLLGYPRTLEEAEDLELELSGFIDPKRLPLPPSHYKKLEAWIIAEPSGLIQRTPSLHKSIFDRSIKLEVPAQVLVKRAVDRRVDASGNVYNLTFSPPPDNLLPKLKPMEHPNEEEILKALEEFSTEKKAMNSWHSRFGIDEWSSFLNISETKLETVKEIIEKKIQEWLKIREESLNMPESTDRKLEFRDRIILISLADSKSLHSEWQEMRDSYLLELSTSLGSIQNLNTSLEEARESLLQRFEEYLCRPDDKQALIDPFIDKLSSLLESKAIITSRSRKNMLDELDNLSDQLWDIIEYRKNENLRLFEELKEEDPSISLGNAVTECAAAIINAEVRKLIRSVNLILNFQQKVLGEQGFESLTMEGINFDQQDMYGEEKIQFIVVRAKEFMEYIPNFSSKIEAVTQFLLRIQQIEAWSYKTLDLISSTSRSTFQIMDSWVGDAVLAENTFVNEIINAWKESAKDRILSEHRLIQDNSNISYYLRKEL